MSHTLWSTVPTTRSQRAPTVPNHDNVLANDDKLKARQKDNHDSHRGARVLPHLSPGDSVWMPDHHTEASVEQEVGPQSFQVTTSDGSYCRNRRDLIRLPDSMDHSPPDTPNQTESTTSNGTFELNNPRHSN